MIRCKLISPTNLLLEHPLYLAPHDESEFWVVTRKDFKEQRREWVYYGAIIGFTVASLFLVALLSIIPK